MFRYLALILAKLTDPQKDSFQNNFSRDNIMKSAQKLIATQTRKEQKPQENMSSEVIGLKKNQHFQLSRFLLKHANTT